MNIRYGNDSRLNWNNFFNSTIKEPCFFVLPDVVWNEISTWSQLIPVLFDLEHPGSFLRVSGMIYILFVRIKDLVKSPKYQWIHIIKIDMKIILNYWKVSKKGVIPYVPGGIPYGGYGISNR